MKEIGYKLHKDRDEIYNFCLQHNRIIIYGAGWVARAMLQYLLDDKFDIYAFCVSNGYKDKNDFCSRKVYELGEIVFKENDGIILAAGYGLQEEMVMSLQKIEFPLKDVYIQQIYYRDSIPRMIESCLIRQDEGEEIYFSEYTYLDKLGQEYGTDKCSKMHNYLNKYEFFVNCWQDKKINILELGVYEGSSLHMWGEYFSKATIYGVDIMEKCLRFEGENRKILIQDLSDENALENLRTIHPTIIIDDASHFWSHQIKALYHLLPMLERGGIYILEDLGTSFNSYKHMNFNDASVSAYDFLAAVSEVVTSGEMLRTIHLRTELMALKQEIEFLAGQIAMISFIHESAIIIKR